jgi:hypothetical protein
MSDPNNDDRNFVDVAKDVSRNWSGEEITPDGMLNEFELFGPAKRAGILDDIDKDFRDASPSSDPSALRKYSEMVTLRREMQRRHHTLRRAGR